MLQHSGDGLLQPVALGAEINAQVVFAVLDVVAAIFEDDASLMGEMSGQFSGATFICADVNPARYDDSGFIIFQAGKWVWMASAR